MGWILIAQFIFTLAMALKCYPLQPGGLLALEAIMMGMATPEAVYNETVGNFQVIMLLMFMVAGIYFMRDMLLYTFTKILLGVRSKTLLSFLFCFCWGCFIGLSRCFDGYSGAYHSLCGFLLYISQGCIGKERSKFST